MYHLVQFKRTKCLLLMLAFTVGVQTASAEPLLNVTGEDLVQELSPGGAALLGTMIVSTVQAFQSGLADANHTLRLIDELIATKKEINGFRQKEVSQANIKSLDQLNGKKREIIRVLTALQNQSFERVGAAELRLRKEELKKKFKAAAALNRYIVVGGNLVAVGLLSLGTYNLLESDHRVRNSLQNTQFQPAQFENLGVQFWQTLRLHLEWAWSSNSLLD